MASGLCDFFQVALPGEEIQKREAGCEPVEVGELVPFVIGRCLAERVLSGHRFVKGLLHDSAGVYFLRFFKFHVY